MLTLCQPQDLNQDDQFVRSALLQWAASLKDFGFDGLRIDTVPEVKPSFWSEFTQAAAMYTVGMSTRQLNRINAQTSFAGEALNGDVGYVAQFQVGTTARHPSALPSPTYLKCISSGSVERNVVISTFFRPARLLHGRRWQLAAHVPNQFLPQSKQRFLPSTLQRCHSFGHFC
jgi:hypothetical protein